MNLTEVRKKVCNWEGWMIISFPFQKKSIEWLTDAFYAESQLPTFQTKIFLEPKLMISLPCSLYFLHMLSVSGIQSSRQKQEIALFLVNKAYHTSHTCS